MSFPIVLPTDLEVGTEIFILKIYKMNAVGPLHYQIEQGYVINHDHKKICYAAASSRRVEFTGYDDVFLNAEDAKKAKEGKKSELAQAEFKKI